MKIKDKLFAVTAGCDVIPLVITKFVAAGVYTRITTELDVEPGVVVDNRLSDEHFLYFRELWLDDCEQIKKKNVFHSEAEARTLALARARRSMGDARHELSRLVHLVESLT